MATVDKYTIDIDVQGAGKIDQLKNGLNGLGGAIAGIGIAAFARSILELGDAVSDLSDATGLSIENIARFSNALTMAGGESKNAAKSIATFYQQVDQAAQGSQTAQKALEKVGITFKDLQQLSEQDLLSKTIDGLANMNAGAERTAAGIAVFGKAFRSIDPAKFKEMFEHGNYDGVADALKKAGDMADKMANNMHMLELAGAKAFDGMTKALEPFIGKVEEGGLTLEQADKIIKAVGISIALVFGAKTIAFMVEFIAIMKELNVVTKTQAILQTTIAALQGPKGWAMLAAGAVAATGAIYALNKAMEETPGAPKASETGTTPSAGPARTAQLYTDQELQARNQALATAKAQTLEQAKQNKEAQDYLRIITATIGMDQDQAAIIKANADLEKSANDQILALEKQISAEKSKGIMVMGQLKGVNDGVIDQYNKQIQQINDNLETTKKLKQEEIERLANLREQINANNMLLELVNSKNKVNDESRMNEQRALVATGILTEEQAQRKMELLAEEFKNTETKNKLVTQLGNATNDMEKRNIKELMTNEADRYKSAVENINKLREIEDYKRNSSVAGAKAAMESIARSTDPFVLAQNRVNALFNNMNSAIDNFVKNGKFSFSDFARSVIQDLISIQLKAQATALLKGLGGAIGGGGGLFGGAIIPGFLASGGEATAGKPYIVGEQGPELFVPNSTGTVVPNSQMGGGGSSTTHNTYITNNISAIDSRSVAQMFAENRKSLLGTVLLAQKEMPYSNR